MAISALDLDDPGHMTAGQYRKALRDLGMTHGGKSTIAFLGIDMSTSYRYARNVTKVPKPVAMLLRVMIQYGLTPEIVEAINQGAL